jgi:glycine/D-amino acid oxidase-like deaminating enzyme
MTTGDADVPIERACYWLARDAAEPGPPLDGERRADVVVVGAGLTGLWTAIHLLLLAPALDVVVVEKERVAYGASGRNAGMLSDTIDHSHELAIDHFGEEEAARLAALGRANVDDMLRFLAERRVDCDLERTGTLTVALSDAHFAQLEASIACARQVGVSDWRLLDRDEAQGAIRCPLYRGAVLNPAGGVLDPAKLVTGLAREAARLGATVYERSPVVALEEDGSGVRVRTERGAVRATTCLLGTSAYTHTLVPSASHRFLPLYDYAVVSEQLSTAEREAIGWRGRQGVNDARAFFNYYRLTADDRILWGTSEAAYYPPNRVDAACDHSERHYAALRASFTAHFPALSALRFPYAWGGAICATTRFTPFVGRALGGRVLYALGYTGHGLGTTHLFARILAHLALRRGSPLLDLRLAREAPLPYPPEPLRAWAVARVWDALKRVDEGEPPGLLLRCLDAIGIGLSS